MMLHRHFENERKREGMTTLADVTPGAREATAPESPTPAPEQTEPPKRGRKKKTETETETETD